MSATEQTRRTYEAFREYVNDHVPDGNRGRDCARVLTFRVNRINDGSGRRFWCIDHGWTVTHGHRFDCPYCMPNLPDDVAPRPRVVSIDRATGMVALNPS